MEDLAKVVESLGGSKPAEMMTLDEAERKVREVREARAAIHIYIYIYKYIYIYILVYIYMLVYIYIYV